MRRKVSTGWMAVAGFAGVFALTAGATSLGHALFYASVGALVVGVFGDSLLGKVRRRVERAGTAQALARRWGLSDPTVMRVGDTWVDVGYVAGDLDCRITLRPPEEASVALDPRLPWFGHPELLARADARPLVERLTTHHGLEIKADRIELAVALDFMEAPSGDAIRALVAACLPDGPRLRAIAADSAVGRALRAEALDKAAEIDPGAETRAALFAHLDGPLRAAALSGLARALPPTREWYARLLPLRGDEPVDLVVWLVHGAAESAEPDAARALLVAALLSEEPDAVEAAIDAASASPHPEVAAALYRAGERGVPAHRRAAQEAARALRARLGPALAGRLTSVEGSGRAGAVTVVEE